MIFPVKGTISAGFNELRPLSKPLESRDHVHGAIDIAAPVNTPIYVPEDGELFIAQIVRSNKRGKWNEMKWKDREAFPFQNYFYDVYGSIILLVSKDTGYYHFFCHSWWNQLYNKKIVSKELVTYQEEKRTKRFPIFSYHNLKSPVNVKEGDIIGYVGNAGFSTGSHVHYEIHDNKFQKYEDRIDPEVYYRNLL